MRMRKRIYIQQRSKVSSDWIKGGNAASRCVYMILWLCYLLVAETLEVLSTMLNNKQNLNEMPSSWVASWCGVDYNNNRDKRCIVNSRHNNANVFEDAGADDNSYKVVDVVWVAADGLAETRY